MKKNATCWRVAVAIVLSPLFANAQVADLDKAVPTGLPSSGKPVTSTDTKLTDSPISVIDQLIALEQDLEKKKIKIDWNQVYDDYKTGIKPHRFKGEARLCVLLGIRVAEGTVALKARNKEKLLECATDIETLAKRLDIKESQLKRGFNVRDAVKRGDWMDAFMQLQMLRQDIMRALDGLNGNDRSKGVLIACGGWYQGSRIVINTIQEHYDPVMTNYLRAPMLVLLIKHELNNLTNVEVKNSAEVQMMLADIDKIHAAVNLDKDPHIPQGQLSPEKLGDLRLMAERFVSFAMDESNL